MARAIAIFLVFGLAATAQRPDAEQIVRRSMERDIFNSEQLRNYTFVQEVEEKHLDGDGNVKRTKIETSEVVMLYGEPHERLIRRDGNPLLPAEKRKHEEKLNRVIEKRSKETETEKAKRLAEAEKARRKSREFLQKIPEAFTLHLIGEETLAGNETWVVEAIPNPAFRPYDRDTKRLTKLKGKLWISKADYEWVKLQAETIENISFGGVIARMNKGAVLEFEQTRVNDEVWLPSRVHVNFDARLALVKSLRRAIDISFSDYRKFHSDSRIVFTSATPESHVSSAPE
jgi:hypothetical protein